MTFKNGSNLFIFPIKKLNYLVMSEPADYEENEVEMQVVEKPISQEEEDHLLAEDADEERMEDARSRVAPSTITLSPTHSSCSNTTDTGNNSYMSRAYWTIRAARQATMSVRKLSAGTM